MWKKWICHSVMLVSICSFALVHGEWIAEDAFWEQDADSFEVLKSAEYTSMKDKMKTTLAGTWCSEEKMHLLMDFVLLYKPQMCVEIGAGMGSSALPIAAALNYVGEGKLYAVDAWSNEIAVQHMLPNDPNRVWWETVDMGQLRGICEHFLASSNLDVSCTLVAGSSEHAVNLFDEIDFLHIDGDYTDVGSLQDVELYLPKVKAGGHILLSNLFIMVNGKQPKLSSFCKLLETCDIVCGIERDNAVLFKKRAE